MFHRLEVRSIAPTLALTILSLWLIAAVPGAWAQESAPVAEAQPGADEPASEEEPLTLGKALTEGKAGLSLNYRYENVDQDDFDKQAHASTLRTALRYKTLAYYGFSAFLEAENVSYIGNDNFNSTGNGNTERPVVADPKGTDFNQWLLQFESGGNQLKGGRQEIVIDDARFVGNVGWRQHHQTYEAFRFRNNSLENWTFRYSYLDRVHRITRDTRDLKSHLINIGFDVGVGKLTGYGYLLDYTQEQFVHLSSDTYGLEFVGKHVLKGGTGLLYEAEYAGQSDAGDNPNRVSADYLHGMFGVAFKPVTIKLGYEKLGGSEDDGQFLTTLATLHKFNGWADKFLNTPTNGLEDIYLDVGGKVWKINWKAVYHDFSSDSLGIDYGSEIDFLLKYTAPWKQSFLLKGALYEAKDFSVDTKKIWLQTSWGF